MNNNRGNNRRRGRGNNRQNGGGQQLNRIDSRARGNAPQLLEKYRKLAHDAHLNGDRVTEEYYLQFADHYFRVLADTRVRQDEVRQRRDDRWQDNGGEGDREYGDDVGEYGESGYDDVRNDRYERAPRPERMERPERQPRYDTRPEQVPDEPAVSESDLDAGEAVEASDASNPYEPAANPFVRDGRSTRGLRQRRPRSDRDAVEASGGPGGGHGDSLDPAALPPALSLPSSEEPDSGEIASAPEQDVVVEAEAAPKPRRRTRRPRQPVDDADETLQAVN